MTHFLTVHELAFILSKDGLHIGPRNGAPEGLDVSKCCNKIVVEFVADDFVQATMSVNVTGVLADNIMVLCEMVDPEKAQGEPE